MKNLIIILTSILLAQSVFAQTNYYPLDSAIIHKEGYSYKYDPLMSISKYLYNADAIYHNVVEYARRDGQAFSEAEQLSFSEKYNPISDANYSMDYIDSLIRSKFSEEQKSLVSNQATITTLGIILTINSTTGDVADVVFIISNFGKFMYIPLDIYRCIELEIKRLLVFELTEYASELNYASMSWSIDFKKDTNS